ncbi:MAG TPA: hypothetical protein VNO26_00845 [Candidatus Limnocylindria bacterium]|nr:hypothetical protein [Candidatus Limnocylindria bacterium]
MSDAAGEGRGLATSCMVETAEGPVAMHETPKKGFAVLTRFDGGGLGFRQLLKVEQRDDVPLVRVVLDNGHSVLAAHGHPFYRAGMTPVAAAALTPGDALETAFHYPEGYHPATERRDPSAWGIHVVRVEPAGHGSVMFGTVRDTHRMFVTAGVLCGE